MDNQNEMIVAAVRTYDSTHNPTKEQCMLYASILISKGKDIGIASLQKVRRITKETAASQYRKAERYTQNTN